jgi:hypothetical protein
MNMEQNYNTEQPEGGVPIRMWTRGVPVEDEAKQQLANAAHRPVAAAGDRDEDGGGGGDDEGHGGRSGAVGKRAL